jgi:hypothetical protein
MTFAQLRAELLARGFRELSDAEVASILRRALDAQGAE